MLYHYFPDVSGPAPIRTFWLHGYLSVDLFFILSGFVMALNYGGAFAADFSVKTYADFLWKRLGRVYPLYIVVTLAMAAHAYAVGVAQKSPSAWTLISNILLVQAWGFADCLGGPTWSISTEFAAYLLFPVLVATILLGRRAWSWLAAAGAVFILVLVATRSLAELNQIYDGVTARNGPLDVFGIFTTYPLLRCLGGFILGVVTFRIAQHPAAQRLAGRRFAGDIALLAVVAVMAVPGSDIALMILFVPLVLALAAQRSLAARTLGTRAIYWLGLVSFSIYLMHCPVEGLFRKPLTAGLSALPLPHAAWMAGVVMVGLLFACSAATYYGIEKPARDWSRNLMRRRPRFTSQPASVAPLWSPGKPASHSLAPVRLEPRSQSEV